MPSVFRYYLLTLLPLLALDQATKVWVRDRLEAGGGQKKTAATGGTVCCGSQRTPKRAAEVIDTADFDRPQQQIHRYGKRVQEKAFSRTEIAGV